MILATLLALTAPQVLPERLTPFRVTFNQIGKQGGVQRVIVYARTQNEARRQAETIYRERATSVVPLKTREDRR